MQEWSFGQTLSVFLVGVATGAALDRLREHRSQRKRRSREIFEPLCAQLVAGRSQISACEQADAINLAFWDALNNLGRMDEIPEDLHQPLRQFFSETAPNYVAAWVEVNGQAVQSLLEPYSGKFGIEHAGVQLGFEKPHRFPKWYRFLGAEKFQPALLELDDQKVIPLWNNKLATEATLSKAGLTIDEFLQSVWSEARNVAPFRNLCEFRLTALRQISNLIDELSRRISR